MSFPFLNHQKQPFYKFYFFFLVCAILPPTFEAFAFFHDRWVVWQDFKCLNDQLPKDTKAKKEVVWQDFPQCHISSRKPFGWRSQRACFSGSPWLLVSMDHRLLFWGMLAGLPFLISSVFFMHKVKIIKRKREWIIWGLCGFAWLISIIFQVAVEHGVIKYNGPDQLNTFMKFWWTIRLSSLTYYFLVLLLIVLQIVLIFRLAKNAPPLQR